MQLLRDGRLGGIILFARNIESPTQLQDLVASLHDAAPKELPAIVGIDQEGGVVQRLPSPWTRWPAMRELGGADDPRQTRALAKALAIELRDVGIGLTFAPVADVDSNPDNPIIGDRSFGADPELVCRHVCAFIEGASEVGVATCAKHFPGHGDTATDSHLELPRLSHDLQRLRGCELVPFVAAARAGVPSIMTAHIVFAELDADWPATMAPAVMSLLRDEIGYDGVVFSDDLEMKAIASHYPIATAVSQLLRAGVDVPLVCHTWATQQQALACLDNDVPRELIDRSLARVLAFKQRFAGHSPVGNAGPPYAEHQALARQLSHGRPA